MDVKGEVLLQVLNKSKLRNGTKTYLEQNFFKWRISALSFSRKTHTLIPKNDVTEPTARLL